MNGQGSMLVCLATALVYLQPSININAFWLFHALATTDARIDLPLTHYCWQHDCCLTPVYFSEHLTKVSTWSEITITISKKLISQNILYRDWKTPALQTNHSIP